ncbi:hypothetical protein KUL42_29450 [Alteromonas sp. KUL42]|nr:hypothetical protein KUL42_29450 [Alteromonas sp. KUL42]
MIKNKIATNDIIKYSTRNLIDNDLLNNMKNKKTLKVKRTNSVLAPQK